jgi:glycerol-3-phosphate dehydrogenase
MSLAFSQSGLISITGGKYRTYRVLAADAVDATRVDLGRHVPNSVTEDIVVLGAQGYHAMVNQIDRFAREHGLPGWWITRLLDRYCSMATKLFE